MVLPFFYDKMFPPKIIDYSEKKKEIARFIKELELREEKKKSWIHKGKRKKRFKKKFPKQHIIKNDNREPLKKPNKKRVVRKLVMKDLNAASLNDLDSLGYLPSHLKRRIIKFRNKLGGYYSVEQLKDVYGMKDYYLGKIKSCFYVDNNKIKRLNLNFVEVNDLQSNPYINKNIAKKIIANRTQNGAYASVSDIKKCVPDSLYSKIKFYLFVK